MESHLVMSAQNPICLDPSTDVACVNNRLYYNKLKFNSLTVRKKAFACKRLRLEGIPSFVKPRQRYATIPGNLSYGRVSCYISSYPDLYALNLVVVGIVETNEIEMHIFRHH